MDLSAFRNRTVLVTGHTGFKGVWMSKALTMLGANVVGYSIDPPTTPNLFEMIEMRKKLTHIHGDVCNRQLLQETIRQYQPEFVFHLAAQPIVMEGYRDPAHTYETNVMGTVNLLEAVRQNRGVRSFVNVTTDKVYHNNEWLWGYRENEPLDGYDPYSNSKSCSELVTWTYQRSYPDMPAISTCRAGNVIGGGDFADNRIIPDCLRAVQAGKPILLRNPNAVRPYQHVIEPIMAYLSVAIQQTEAEKYQGAYNIGPDIADCVTTGALVDLFCKYWGGDASKENAPLTEAPHEANVLRLDCSRIKELLGWSPIWKIDRAIAETVKWGQAYLRGEDVESIMEKQIQIYLEEASGDI